MSMKASETTTRAIAFAAVLLGLATPAFPCSVKPTNSIEQLLQAAFAARNPKVTCAKVLELRSTRNGSGPYVLLGWGIRPDFKFEGVLEDELFGVFVLDKDLTRIERTLSVFPTCRWADCIVSIERVSESEVVVAGAGSYGDVPFRKTYKLGPLWGDSHTPAGKVR